MESGLYGIMRSEKRQAGAIGGIEAENNRTEKINLPRSDIDWSRTKENVHLVKSDNFKADIEKIAAENGVRIRTNSVVSIDTLFSASPGFFEKLSREETIMYYRECVEFAREHFGVVYNAVIHFDETTPHLHVMSVPIMIDETGKARLSARDLMGTPKAYHQRQDEFFDKVSSHWGLERGEIRDAETRREHLDTLDYKLEQRETEIKKAEIEKAAVKAETEKAEIYRIELEQTNKRLENQAERLENKIGSLEKIGEIIENLKLSVSEMFNRIRDKIEIGFERVLQAVENGGALRADVLRDGFCKMITARIRDGLREIVRFVPATMRGDKLSWNGVKPLYKLKNGNFSPAGYVTDGETKGVSWEQLFTESHRDKILLPLEQDHIDINTMIGDITGIVHDERIRDIQFELLSDLEDQARNELPDNLEEVEPDGVDIESAAGCVDAPEEDQDNIEIYMED